MRIIWGLYFWYMVFAFIGAILKEANLRALQSAGVIDWPWWQIFSSAWVAPICGLVFGAFLYLAFVLTHAVRDWWGSKP